MFKKTIDARTTSHHTALHRMAAPLVNKTVRLSNEQIDGLKKEAELDKRDHWTSLVRIAVDEMLEARRKQREAAQLQEAAA